MADQHRHRGIVLGRYIITTSPQAGGHPWVDSGRTEDKEGRQYKALAIRPSLRRQYNRKGGRCLVLGRRIPRYVHILADEIVPLAGDRTPLRQARCGAMERQGGDRLDMTVWRDEATCPQCAPRLGG